jgi:G6PDH family F420-dependent oxidoreductase
MEIGYALSSEEHEPARLVDFARRAEDAGFGFALISDHYHPWIDRQGQSPFVWAVLGAIARETRRLRLGTGVTCPMIRLHPAIVAQAAATVAAMMPGRFFLGVGSGEQLNEHVLGGRWPRARERLEMLDEAIGVMRLLWRGETCSHRGRHYTVDEARVYTRPSRPPPIMVAASAPRAARLAGRIGDGLINVAPDAGIRERFVAAGGRGKPCVGQVTVCWAADEAAARRTAHAWWPNVALPGDLSQDLRAPRLFAQAARLVSEDDVARAVVCGPDPARHVAAIRRFADAGYDHVYVHQVGPDQEGFFDFYAREVMPRLGRGGAAPAAEGVSARATGRPSAPRPAAQADAPRRAPGKTPGQAEGDRETVEAALRRRERRRRGGRR